MLYSLDDTETNYLLNVSTGEWTKLFPRNYTKVRSVHTYRTLYLIPKCTLVVITTKSAWPSRQNIYRYCQVYSVIWNTMPSEKHPRVQRNPHILVSISDWYFYRNEKVVLGFGTHDNKLYSRNQVAECTDNRKLLVSYIDISTTSRHITYPLYNAGRSTTVRVNNNNKP